MKIVITWEKENIFYHMLRGMSKQNADFIGMGRDLGRERIDWKIGLASGGKLCFVGGFFAFIVLGEK